MKKFYLTILSFALIFGSAKSQTVIPASGEVVFPQYAYYGGSADARIQYVCRLKITGLTAGAYRYTTAMNSSATATTQSPGYLVEIRNAVTPSNGNITGMASTKAIGGTAQLGSDQIHYVTTSSYYGGFSVPVGSTEYEGWFACVPNGVSGKQDAGSDVYFYLQLSTVNGTTPISYYRTTNTIKLLDLNTTSSDATAITGTSTTGDEKIVFLYPTTDFSTRPLAGSWTENDGLAQSTFTENGVAAWTSWYGAVDGISGSWGTIIPNNLASGVRGIKYYSIDATGTAITSSVTKSITSFNGSWGGAGVSTVNPSGGTTAINIVADESTLPISLTNFSASVKESGVKLNWQTAQEINNQYFEILKSTDGKSFNAITKVDGSGNSTENKYYSYTDYNPKKGTNYYQLKQVDYDGKSTNSKVIAADFGLTQEGISLTSVSDNEISISLALSKAQSGILTFTGLDGKLLYQKDVNLTEGINSLTIPVSSSSSKIGILSFSSPFGRQSLKISR